MNALLTQAISHDPEALGHLLTLQRPYLKMLATAQIYQRLQGKADASDLVQEACLEAHRNLDKFRGSSMPEFSAWLRGILANLLAKHVRYYLGTHQRDVNLERSLVGDFERASGILERGFLAREQSPSEVLQQSERMYMVSSAIDALPEDYRTVILLRNIEGLPFRDIAEAMGRTVDSVEKLWVRGLTRLKQEIKNRSSVDQSGTDMR